MPELPLTNFKFSKMKKYLLLLSICVITFACEEDTPDDPKINPTVSLSKPEVSNIGLYSAIVKSSISFEESTELPNKQFGIAWSTAPNPEPHDTIQQAWFNYSASIISMSPYPIAEQSYDLELNTTYYVRPYFVHEDNSVIYGPENTFTTLAGDGWHTLTNFPGELDQWPVGFAIDNKIYMGIGLVNGSSISSVNNEWWEYDITTDQWTQKTDFPGNAGIQAVGFSIGNKGYVLSANQEENPAAFWEYDATEDRWTRKTDLPSNGRMDPATFVIDGKGYIMGGLSAQEHLWEFDPNATSEGMDAHGNPMGAWSQKAYYEGESDNIYLPSVFVIDGQAYIYNLYTTRDEEGNRITNSEFWSYNPTTDLWFEKANFPGEMRQDMVSFSINGKGYMGGERDPDFWEYNPSTNTWTQKSDAPTSGHELSFSIGSRGYFFSETNSIIEYVP